VANSIYDISDRKISVVIPSLGGLELEGTIDSINASTLKPDEILICLPCNETGSFNVSQHDNVRVISTKNKGQVVQRAVGFSQAKNEFVLQVDDDIILASDCIEKLYTALKDLGPLASVSPTFYDLNTSASVYKKVLYKRKWMEKLYYYLINGKLGYQMGTVDMTGSPIGVDPERVLDKNYIVEWLPGGCVMHYKNNLVLDNYFPLQGKAYCEDLIHSLLLTRKNIFLYINTSSKCFFDNEGYSDLSMLQFIRMLKTEFRARRYYLLQKNRYSKRIFVFYILMISNFIFKRIKRIKHPSGDN